MKKTYITPWKNKNEWNMVYDGIFSEDKDEQNEALKLIGIWKCRLKNRLPISVELTRDIVQLKFATEPKMERTRVYQQSMMIIRFVNLITESARKRQINLPINKIAERLGIPEWLVELRHDATHDSLPSGASLSLALDIALNWLKVQYWEKEANMKCDTFLNTTPEVLLLFMDFFEQNRLKGSSDSELLERLQTLSKSHPANVADVLIRRVLCPGPGEPYYLEPDVLHSGSTTRAAHLPSTVSPSSATASDVSGLSDKTKPVKSAVNASNATTESRIASSRLSKSVSSKGRVSYMAAPVTKSPPPEVLSTVRLLVETVMCCPGADGGITPADLVGALAAHRMLTRCPISRRESARWIHTLALDFLGPPENARCSARLTWPAVEQCLASATDPYTLPVAVSLSDRVRWHPAWHDQARKFCATLSDSLPVELRDLGGSEHGGEESKVLNQGKVGSAGNCCKRPLELSAEGSPKRRRVSGDNDKLARGIALLPGPPCDECDGRCLLGMACECEDDSLILPLFEQASDFDTRLYFTCQPLLRKDAKKLKPRNIRLF